MSDQEKVSPDPGKDLRKTQKNIEIQLKELRETLSREIDAFKKQTKSSLESTDKFSHDKQENLRKHLSSTIESYEAFSKDQLGDLKESLDGQLESLRGFAHKLVEDEELRLVNSIEVSLTNVSDITNSQVSNLKSLVSKVNEVADKSSEISIEIAKERDRKVKDEIAEQLKLDSHALSSEILALQDRFRDEINEKIEKVFMGVTMTKEGISGIIKDTLSRLEENLNLLTEGIDENFTREIGEAQDLIHHYEGKMIEAIEKIQDIHENHIGEILERHSNFTQNSLMELTSELNEFKRTIFDQIEELNEEQKELFANATSQLSEQIDKSRKEVIESHGTLKDDLDTLIKTNSENINEVLENIHSASTKTTSNMKNEIITQITDLTTTSSTNFSKLKKETEKNYTDLKSQFQERIKSTESEIKQADTG